MTIKDLAQAIHRADSQAEVRLVAIDGGAGSGKTTFAGHLAAELGANIVQIDDFISVTDLESWWPRMEQDVLEPMFRGENLRYQVRDWVQDVAGDSIGPWKETPWTPTMILEGVGAARLALASRVAYSIFVEAPVALRMERGLERDADVENNRAIWEHWMEIESEFFARDGTRERADLIIDGENWPPEPDRFRLWNGPL